MTHGLRRTRAVAASVAATALLALVPVAAGADSAGPRVSVISDSILTAVTWGNAPAQAALSQGLDLQIDAGVGRRLNGQSAEFAGSYVPTTLAVVNSWINQLGSVVVIVDGYNDLPDHFAADVELTLDTLRNHGVQHVLWVNLHAIQPEYAAKDVVLATAAKHHPELRVLDWNTYSSAHPDWYQTDFVHLRPAGGVAIATWIRQAIGDALAPPPPPPPRDPALVVAPHQKMLARVGRRFDRLLHAGGGTMPLRWHVGNASLRKAGLHLLANGKLVGKPARAGTFTVPLQLTDAGGSSASVLVTLVVKPGDEKARAHEAQLIVRRLQPHS